MKFNLTVVDDIKAIIDHNFIHCIFLIIYLGNSPSVKGGGSSKAIAFKGKYKAKKWCGYVPNHNTLYGRGIQIF